VKIIARSTLRAFWERHADAEQPLKDWFHDVSSMQWQSPADIKRVYANAIAIPNENGMLRYV